MSLVGIPMHKPVNSDWKFDKSISSHVDEASAVIRELVDQLKKNQWSEKDLFAVHMATEEALMNAVKHGNEHDENKSVHVLMLLNESEFYARIEDEGIGFDPDNVPDPCEDCNLDKTSGRGVLLIRRFVDDVVYNEAGNVIEFRKTRTH